MAKKISRKQLLKEPDEFISFTGKLIQNVIRYQKQIFITIGIAVAIVIVFSLVKFYTNRAENNAFTLLSQANKQYQSLLTSMGPVLSLKEVENKFEHILDKYPRYQGGKIAGIYYANYCYEAGEYDKAAQLYTNALGHFKDDPAYRNLILSSLAHSYNGKKNQESSIKYFEMITFSDVPVFKDEALFHLGRSYGQSGNETKQDELYRTLVSEYPDSIYTQWVKDHLSFSG